MSPKLYVTRSLLLGVLAGAGLALAWPSEAGAKDEFEDGFKDELGRLSAHGAFGVGRHILGEILFGYPGYERHAVHTYHPRYRNRRRGYYDDYRGGYHRRPYYRRHRHHHHHYRHHHHRRPYRHYRHYDDCD